MPRITSGQVFNLPPPFKGQMDDLPIVSVENPFCQRLYNFNQKVGALELRLGNSRVARNLFAYSTVGIHQCHDSTLMAVVQDGVNLRFYSQIDSNPANPATLETTVATASATEIDSYSVTFNNTTFFFGTAGLRTLGGISMNTAHTFTSTPYTFSGGFLPIQGAVYKNRLYMIDDEATEISYSDVDGIAGATTLLDFGGALTKGGFISGVFSLAISDTISAQDFFCILTNKGELVVYSGSYPESPDWGIVGRFFISSPLGYKSLIPYQGDVLIMTQSYLVSARDLFTQGNSVAIENALSTPITYLWREIATANLNLTSAGGGSGVWDETENRLVITFYQVPAISGSLSVGLGMFFLTFDIDTKSWAVHQSRLSIDCYVKSMVYVLSSEVETFGRVMFMPLWPGQADNSSVYIKEWGSSIAGDDYKDDQVVAGVNSEVQYDYEIISAPLPLPRDRSSLFQGLEIIMESDDYVSQYLLLRGDLGSTVTDFIQISSPGTDIANSFYSLGIDATYVQYQFLGQPEPANESEIGTRIYGVNVLYSPGGLR